MSGIMLNVVGGTFGVPPPPLSIDYLVVAGGGGAGRAQSG